MMNLMRNDRTVSQRLACWFENGLEGQALLVRCTQWGQGGAGRSTVEGG